MNGETLVDDPSRLGLQQRLRFLAGDVVLYGGASAFSAAFGLVSFPVLARHFSLEQYGVLDFFGVITFFLTTAFVFGQDSALARFFYEYTETPQRREVASQSLAIQAALLAVGLPLLGWAADHIAAFLSDAPDAPQLMRIALLQVPFLVVLNYAQTILKWTFRRTQFLIVSVGSTCAALTCLVLAVVVFQVRSVVPVFQVLLGTRAAAAVVGLWFVRDWLRMPREWGVTRQMVPFALPLGVICTAGVLMPVVERGLVAGFVGERELGLYAAGARVAMLVGMPIAAFQMAWGPFSFAIHKEADVAQTYDRVLQAFAFTMLGAVLLLGIFAGPVIRLLASERYAAASGVVFPLALGLAVEGIGWITSIGIGIAKRTHLHLYAYGAYTAVTVGAIYVCVQVFGFIGAAWGVLLGHLVKSSVETWFAHRVHDIRFSLTGVIAAVIATLCLGIGYQRLAAHFAR